MAIVYLIIPMRSLDHSSNQSCFDCISEFCADIFSRDILML